MLRRHLKEGQRAIAAAKLANMPAHRPNNKSANSQAEAAAMFNVSTRSVASAAKILEEGTQELQHAAEQGKIAVSAAADLTETPAEFQRAVVEKVDAGAKFTEAMRQLKKAQVAQKVEALPEGKYRVIYADPPWQYNDSRVGVMQATAAEDHYPTVPLEELCALDVKSLAADDSVLLCWATFPLLRDALQLVEAWGFTYKTAFVWDKVRTNFGNYHTAENELLLVCTRGSCLPDPDKRERQSHHVERGAHSAKPEYFRELIDRQWPHGPRVELFRRGDAPEGWTVWGNEVVA
jgi:N6-adenosine-specific RNA methylase IME4